MRFRRWYALVGLVLLLGFLFLTKNDDFAPVAATAFLPPDLVAVAPPGAMPAFSLPGIKRPDLSSNELLGKVVVLRFWATH